MLLPPNRFNSLQKGLFSTNLKKNSAPTVIEPGVADGRRGWGETIERLQKPCIYTFPIFDAVGRWRLLVQNNENMSF